MICFPNLGHNIMLFWGVVVVARGARRTLNTTTFPQGKHSMSCPSPPKKQRMCSEMFGCAICPVALWMFVFFQYICSGFFVANSILVMNFDLQWLKTLRGWDGEVQGEERFSNSEELNYFLVLLPRHHPGNRQASTHTVMHQHHQTMKPCFARCCHTMATSVSSFTQKVWLRRVSHCKLPQNYALYFWNVHYLFTV